MSPPPSGSTASLTARQFQGQVYHGTVTLRDALAHSLNVPTVKVAEMVGYDAVVEMANRAGMNYKIQPTPAVALGAYEITPLEAVGAYTVFANGGELREAQFPLAGARLGRAARRCTGIGSSASRCSTRAWPTS